jgi:hypothetical protein
VLLDAGADGEDVGIEDDVLGRNADLLHENAISAFADASLVGKRRSLALFVECHDYDRRAVF